MANKNVVTAGAYKGAKLVVRGWITKELHLEEQKLFGAKRFKLDKETVHKVGIVDTNSTKSMSSALLRGGAGAVLLGPVGIAAALSAKNNKTHQIMITFSDGKESMAIVDNDLLTMLQDIILNSQGEGQNLNFNEDDCYKSDEVEITATPQPNISTTPQPDLATQLTQLASLRAEGTLTEEEFAQAKSQLLNGSRHLQTTKQQSFPQAGAQYDVILTKGSTGFKERIFLIKEICSITNLDSRAAKEVVDNTPSMLARKVSFEVATQIVKKVALNGGKAEIKKC